MPWFRKQPAKLILLAASGFAISASLTMLQPAVVRADRAGSFFHGSLSSWLTNIEAGSTIEAALYRVMSLPTGDVLYRRPPSESAQALATLLKQSAAPGALYSLRALQDEQALNFMAAESDWKAWVLHASDRSAAELDLANFYARRLRPEDEIAALMQVAKAPPSPDEVLTANNQQRSWRAFAQILRVIQNNSLGADVADKTWQAWIAHYPAEPEVYSRYFDALIEERRYDDASALAVQYSRVFPTDHVFPIRAQASVAYRRGSVADVLAVYDRRFDPLWPQELVQSYFDLMKETHSLSAFADRMRMKLHTNPDDMHAAARLFYAYQQQGQTDAAKQIITDYRHGKEERDAQWNPQELYIFAKLLEGAQAYPEAARFYFALYNSQGMPDAQQRALAGLIGILLEAPEQPIRLGAGNLSMYRDIATMDQGPGYLNGILSLLLNSANPKDAYTNEDQRAAPYFHRAEAARLLAQLDARFPNASERPALHAKLINAYGAYGENNAVIQAGNDFLTQFPKDPQRVDVALTVADAYARTNRTQEEFALYDQLLRELAQQAQGVPLGDGTTRYSKQVAGRQETVALPATDGGDSGDEAVAPASATQAFSTQVASAASFRVRSVQYQQVLERYLARLVALQQLPRALAVLRGEMEHDPNDPGIYEKLARFLSQNQLGEHEEGVYRKAIQQFNEPGWYAKLARFYLRQKRDADYSSLTEQVTKIFSGTELEAYFATAPSPGGSLSLQVNLYAHKRFPHDLTFTQNLLVLYRAEHTKDYKAWEKLLAEQWFESADLRNEFFEYLARTGKLDQATTQLSTQNGEIGKEDWSALATRNPAAAQFLVASELWQSHFEDCTAAAGALANEYPAKAELGEQAVSLYRSLAYFNSADTDRAAAIEKRLLKARPGDMDRLASIGDIYADRDRFQDAAPFWFRMADVHRGEADGYLQSATVFWDYFDFDNALAQLERGRRDLKNPALYSYEEGAIYESKRDYGKAIVEYRRGAVTDSQSRSRLLVLAQRPEYATQVAAAVAPIALKGDPSQAEVSLLVDVLGAEQHRADLEAALDGILDRSSSFDTLDLIAQTAAQQSLVHVQEHALRRQVAITTDPERRMELRYDLVHFYMNNGNLAAAQPMIDALYQENPRILGVVRATVDCDWTHGSKQRAVAVLQRAAGSAYPSLAQKFNFEAAQKLTDMEQYAQARIVLNSLLKATPFDSSVQEAIAATYGRVGDNAGLRDFYQAQITELKASSIVDKKTKLAALRRGLIPALTQLDDLAGAIDQYIELINAYPEDDGLTNEAALYAERSHQQARLLDFYRKTVTTSAHDSRWAIVLASLETTLEDYPAAIDAYSKAIVIRPDRIDLYTARAALSEKLQHYENAVADYKKLYSLTYNDPQWMERVAEVRARQGRPDLAVAALQTALIDGKPVRAANYFDVAKRLETWNMLEPASQFAQKGVDLAGKDLLADTANHDGAATYARIFARLRKLDSAYATLVTALTASDETPGLVATTARVEEHGIAAVTDNEWREQERAVRESSGRQGFADALKEMAVTAHIYDTPEETASFENFLKTKAASASNSDRKDFYLPAAEAGYLATLQADLEWQLAIAKPEDTGARPSWIQLQRSRLLLNSSAERLEAYAPSVLAKNRYALYSNAANFYHDSGNQEAELRVLGSIGALNEMDGELRQRYFTLLLKKDPSKLITLAATGSSAARNAAAQYAVDYGQAPLVLAAVKARGAGLDPVWTSGYTGLGGLYVNQMNASTDNAFRTSLGGGTIGERIAKPVDRSQQLAGDVWFYYGARYGEYLSLAHAANAQDYLPATVEQASESVDAYEALAAWYRTQGKMEQAIAAYSLALQLHPDDAMIHDRIALLLWREGRKNEALSEWKTAVSLLVKESNASPVPADFWSNFSAVTGHLGEHGQFDMVRPQVDSMLRSYIRRNGSYMTEPLLQSVYAAAGSSNDAMTWLLDLASLSNPPDAILNAIVTKTWISDGQRPRIYERMVDAALAILQSSQGEAHSQAEDKLRQLQIRWIDSLIKADDYAQAKAVLGGLSANDKKTYPAMWLPSELKLAAQDGTLAARVEQWKQKPSDAPSKDLLRNAAVELDPASKDLILGFIYQSAIAENDLAAANFLGLAAIRIRDGNMTRAITLLQRMELVSQDEYDDLDSAASLLNHTGHDAEAIPFLVKLTNGVPWDPAYRLRLDEARIRAGQQRDIALADLAALASDRNVPYTVRTEAAKTLAGKSSEMNLGSEELNLLASGKIGAVAAQRPFFIAARLAAAEAAPVQKRITLLKDAVTMDPQDDAARIQLVRASIEIKDGFLAVAAAAPLLGQAPYYSGDGFAGSTDEANTDATVWSAGLSASLNQLSVTDRAQLLAGIAGAYHMTGDDNAAVARYLQAWHLEDDPARRKELEVKIKWIRRRIAQRATNLEHAPTIHETLDQNHPVRPRELGLAEEREP